MPLFLENDGDDIAFSLIYKFCKNVLQSCSGCFRYHGKLGIETVTDQIRQLASEDIAVPDAPAADNESALHFAPYCR